MGRKTRKKRSRMVKILIEGYQLQSVQDIQEALKDLLGGAIEDMLKAELDDYLDYKYGETPPKSRDTKVYPTSNKKFDKVCIL